MCPAANRIRTPLTKDKSGSYRLEVGAASQRTSYGDSQFWVGKK